MLLPFPQHQNVKNHRINSDYHPQDHEKASERAQVVLAAAAAGDGGELGDQSLHSGLEVYGVIGARAAEGAVASAGWMIVECLLPQVNSALPPRAAKLGSSPGLLHYFLAIWGAAVDPKVMGACYLKKARQPTFGAASLFHTVLTAC